MLWMPDQVRYDGKEPFFKGLFIYLGERAMQKSSAWWVASDSSQIRPIKLIKLIVQFLYVRELNISCKFCQGKNVYLFSTHGIIWIDVSAGVRWNLQVHNRPTGQDGIPWRSPVFYNSEILCWHTPTVFV